MLTTQLKSLARNNVQDPIIQFIQEQNARRDAEINYDPITAARATATVAQDKKEREDYQPIPEFRKRLNEASGAQRDPSIYQEQLDRVEAPKGRRMGAAYQRGTKLAAADFNYFRAGLNALVGNEQRARSLVQKGIKDASEAENVIGSLSMAKEWERFLDEPTFINSPFSKTLSNRT